MCTQQHPQEGVSRRTTFEPALKRWLYLRAVGRSIGRHGDKETVPEFINNSRQRKTRVGGWDGVVLELSGRQGEQEIYLL